MILVGGILLDRQHDCVSAHEACDVVDVPVRVVPDAPLAQPDRLPDAEPVCEHAFVVRPREPGIADLRVAQQPLFGDQKKSLAVDLDAAALENNPPPAIRTLGLFRCCLLYTS